MADKVRIETDKELVKLEKKISGVFKRAQKELKKQWADFMKESAKIIKEYEDAYTEAVRTQDTKKINKAKKALKDAKIRQTFSNEHYRDVLDAVTEKIAVTNEIALSYVNDKMQPIYLMNYNAIAPTANSLGIDFAIMNERTIKRMIKRGNIELPYKNLDKIKDKRWNTKKLNSEVLQGIIQGESMEKIANRILPIVNNNEAAAIRNARTMVTGAENEGRNDSFLDLQKRGTILRRRWIAVPDGRTRAWHLSMDGQEVDPEEPFVDGNGNKLRFPGDPHADPSTVYNCRCGIKSVIVGFKDSEGNVHYVDESLRSETRHDKAIAKEKERRKNNEYNNQR